MPKTSDIVMGTDYRALFIGLSGSGKTLAGASFYEAGKVEFIDFDGRMAPVKLYYPHVDNINYDRFSVENLEKFAYTFLPDLLQKGCPYKTVQLAGITSLSNVAISYQMLQMRGGDNLKRTRGGLMVPSWDQFNGEAMIIAQILDILTALKANVIVEAHPVNRLNAATGEKYTSLVSFGPKVESLIPGYFNEIYYFTTETDINNVRTYVCYTRPTDNCPLAKTSLPLPAKFTLSDENMQPISLYRLIQAELEKHNIKLNSEIEVTNEA
jgi:hypothetical protein